MTDDAPTTATDWSKYTLEQIWSMLHDERSEALHEQARIWFQIESICRHHADQLRAAALKLAESWPAANGNAAERFQSFLTTLVAYMEHTSKAADTNGRAVDSYHGDIMDTRAKIERLAARHEATNRPEYGANPLVVRRALTETAREIMASADTRAHEFHQAVKIPAAFVPRDNGYQPIDERSGADGAGGGDERATAGAPAHADRLIPRGPMSAGPTSGTEPVDPLLAGDFSPVGVPVPSQSDVGSPLTGAPGMPVGPARGIGETNNGSPVGRVIGPVPHATPHSGGAAKAPTGGSSAGTDASFGKGGSAGHSAAGAAGIVGAPMMAGGAGATRDGTRVGRPGGVIGGDRGRRRRPHDPDDPWVIEPEVVVPVIGPKAASAWDDASDEERPPGVVDIKGWPR